MGVDHRRIRLTSCVETILRIQESLDESRVDPVLLRKFRQLEKSLKSIELGLVSDVDIERVEEATNRLLDELGFILSGEDEGDPIHSGPLH